MTFTVHEFEDLITIINQQPEWRGRLLKALFPDLNIAKAMQDLAENNIIMRAMLERMDARLTHVEQDVSLLKQDVSALKQDVSVLKQDVSVLKQDVSVLKQDVSGLKQDVGALKGDSFERQYRDRAAGVFGLYLKNGRDMTSQVSDQLYAALETGTITETELTQVLAADLLWGGELRQTREPVVLVLEVSWLAERSDVDRAVTRRAILRRVGINALAVVAGKEWTDEARQLAVQSRVVITANGRIDRSAWTLATQA